MTRSSQRKDHGAVIVGARIDEQAYNSMVSLMDSAGYKDVSSFVRSAVLTKCQDIASGMVNLYADRVIDNQSYSYKPVSYSRVLNNVI